ncbi:hypothetical protein [Limnoglobus roseus]|uniref:Serine protease n=1 Tax=Limnoglobus roseus TaxID=2598579 RepID=A0A5C1A6K0_9BACT|nr:hypothetical protein [Limnoglobus roseus]QEL13462.1 serine protease [Limnoglobus roseus]
MANISLRCPQCNLPNAVPADQLGQAVICPGCQFSFPAQLQSSGDPKAVELPEIRPVVRAVALKDAKPNAGADQPLPVARKSQSEDDEEEDRPVRRRSGGRRRRDDDGDAYPTRREGGGGLLVPLLLGSGLFVVLIGIGLFGIFADRTSPEPLVLAAAGPQQPVARVEPPPPVNPIPPNAGANRDEAIAKMFEVQRRHVEEEQKRRQNVVPANPNLPAFPNADLVPPLYAAVGPVPITPTPLAGERAEVKLPGTVGEACSGGGGRFYFLHIPSVNQIAVFDVNEGRVVKFITVHADRVKIAAGMNALVVVANDTGSISRYNLTTFARELTVLLPFQGEVKAVALGAASAGPLLVQYAGDGAGGGLNPAPVCFFDPTVLKPVNVKLVADARVPEFLVRDAVHFRASPNGTVFTYWCADPIPSSGVFKAFGGTIETRRNDAGVAVPTDDGLILTNLGPYDYDGRLTHVGLLNRPGVPFVAPSGRFHLTADGLAVSARRVGDSRVFATLPATDFPTPNEPEPTGDLTPDRRVHFVPEAKLVAVLPPSRDRIVLHKFDPAGLFEKVDTDYLFVTGRPPTAAPGKRYAFALGARSKAGGVKYKLDSGPAGLTVSPDGRVSWDVPASFISPAAVVVTVSDAGPRTVTHTFRIVAGVGEPPAVGTPEPPTAVAVAPTPAPLPSVAPKPPQVAPKPPPVPVKPVEPVNVIRQPSAVFSLKPTTADDGATVNLPESADAMCVGGGGRYLIFRLPRNRQLAVFDTVHGRVIKYLPIAEDAALFAAGMSKLYILHPAANVFQRWNLSTFEKEATVANSLAGPPTRMLMGHATDGPLYVAGQNVTSKQYAFLDPTTFRQVEIKYEGGRGEPSVSERRAPQVRVSADGRVYAWWSTDLSPSGISTFVIQGASATGHNIHDSAGALLPGPDGTLFTSLKGVYTPELKPLNDKDRAPRTALVPATSGPWYLAVTGGGATTSTSAVSLDLRMIGDGRSLVVLKNPKGLDAGPRTASKSAGASHLYDRVHFIPEAELLVVVNAAGNALTLHRMNLKTRLEAGGIDYLLVSSHPPGVVGRGTKFEYTPTVLSKQGGVKLKVESGPPGLTVAGDTISWAVPESFDEATANVLLTVSDASGQEVFHTFALSVRDKDAARKMAARGVLPEPSVPPPPIVVVKKDPEPPVPPQKNPGPSASVEPKKEPAPAPKPVAHAAKPSGLRLIVPPPVHPVIGVTEIKDETVVKLPAAADDSCYAGGGRYLLYRLPSLKQLAVFDAQTGTVTKTLPLTDATDLIAGGASKIFVLNAAGKQFTVWNLATFESEKSVPYSFAGTPKGMVVGHGTDGPILVAGIGVQAKPRSAWVDGRTLQEVEVDGAGRDDLIFPATLAASGDGRVYSSFNDFTLSWTELGEAGMATKSKPRTHATPLYDGRIYGSGGYIHPMPEVPATPAKTTVTTRYDYTPAASGPFSVRVSPNATRLADGTEKHAVAILAHGPKLLRVELGTVAVPARKVSTARPASEVIFPVHLFPESKMWAYETPDRTQLTLKRLDLETAFSSRSTDWVLVVGRPPLGAKRGQPLAYKPAVWGNKKSETTVTVEGGPPGMKVENGTVVWDVPAKFEAEVVPVKLRIESGTQTAVQEFDLHLTGG